MAAEILNLPLPPHSVEAEQAVLGSLLLDGRRVWPLVAPILSPADFYRPDHRLTFEAIAELGGEADTVTLYAHLERRQQAEAVGGLAYLSRLTRETASTANAEAYARVVRERAQLRGLAEMGRQLQAQATERGNSAEQLAADLSRRLSELQGRARGGAGLVGSQDLARALVDDLERRREGAGGLATGLADFDEITGGLESGELTIFAGRPGLGKCLGFGTPVLMADGTVKPVQDVVIGDQIMGPDSRPRRVLALGRGRDMLYRVTPTKGDSYVTNGDHILSLMPTDSSSSQEPVNISVLDFLGKSERFKTRMKGWRAAVEWRASDVPLDPYFLGVWLGDGRRSGPVVCKPDEVVLEACAAVAGQHGLRAVRFVENTCPAIRLSGTKRLPNPVYEKLKLLGVVAHKHVPLIYRVNSRAVRLEVLAGLLDTDGFHWGGGFEFVNISEELARDVAFLARSLGLAAYVTACRKACQTGAVGDYWRVGISGDCSMIPTRILRKQAPKRRQIKRVSVTGIKVSPIGSGEYYGFELDGDGLFLLGDFTVTHNTALMVTMAAHVSREHPVAVFSAEMPALQLARRCVALLGGISQTRLRRPKQLTDGDWEHIAEGTGRLGERKLWIDDRQLPPLEHIRAECIGHKARHGLSLVMIDYCQLVEGRGSNRYEQLRDVAYGAKALAKELALPVLLLAQINRGVETREEKRPRMSDLRDSGAIEEAADIVGMLYREGYYDDTFSMPHVVECMLEKHRNGERGQCLWHFAGEFSRMTALEIEARQQYRQLLSRRTSSVRAARPSNEMPFQTPHWSDRDGN